MNKEDKQAMIGTVIGLTIVVVGRSAYRRHKAKKAEERRIEAMRYFIEKTDQFIMDLKFDRIIKEI